jgi:dihydroorotase
VSSRPAEQRLAEAIHLSLVERRRSDPGGREDIESAIRDAVDEQAALERIFAETTLPICAHCEDEATVRANARRFAGETDVAVHSKIRNHEAAIIATRRTIDLATRHRHPFHVLHVSTANEVPLIAAAPDWVTAEVCPHHLFFNIDDYESLGSLIKMNPSIKTATDNAKLWDALMEGVITVIATDHAPHTLLEKASETPPPGVPGVQTMLTLLLTAVHAGRLTIDDIITRCVDAPRRIYTLPAQPDTFVEVDVDAEWTVRDEAMFSRSQWTPFAGMSLRGRVERVTYLGRVVYEEGQVLAEPGSGRVLFQAS